MNNGPHICTRDTMSLAQDDIAPEYLGVNHIDCCIESLGTNKAHEAFIQHLHIGLMLARCGPISSPCQMITSLAKLPAMNHKGLWVAVVGDTSLVETTENRRRARCQFNYGENTLFGWRMRLSRATAAYYLLQPSLV